MIKQQQLSAYIIPYANCAKYLGEGVRKKVQLYHLLLPARRQSPIQVLTGLGVE